MPYCMKCVKELSQDDRFCSRCGTQVPGYNTNTQLLVDKIEVNYPEGDSAKLKMVVGASSLEIGSGAGKFVEGTIDYDIPESKPFVSTTGNIVRIEQTRDPLAYPHYFSNKWNLRLGDAKPFTMELSAGVIRTNLSLGKLPITDLLIEAGAGDTRISFKETNPSIMNNLEARVGAGELKLSGLLNANFEKMRIKGAVGSIDLDFAGEKLQRDAQVNVGSGVGGVTVTVGKGIPARARIRGLTSVRTYGGFFRSGGGFGDSEYQTEDYESSSGPKIELELDLGVGSISLRTSP